MSCQWLTVEETFNQRKALPGKSAGDGSRKSIRLVEERSGDEADAVDADDADWTASEGSLSLSFEPFSFLTIELDRFLGDADGEDLMETMEEERSRPFSFSFSGRRLTFLSSERIS